MTLAIDENRMDLFLESELERDGERERWKPIEPDILKVRETSTHESSVCTQYL